VRLRLRIRKVGNGKIGGVEVGRERVSRDVPNRPRCEGKRRIEPPAVPIRQRGTYASRYVGPSHEENSTFEFPALQHLKGETATAGNYAARTANPLKESQRCETLAHGSPQT